eukprot:gene4187-8325_t
MSYSLDLLRFMRGSTRMIDMMLLNDMAFKVPQRKMITQDAKTSLPHRQFSCVIISDLLSYSSNNDQSSEKVLILRNVFTTEECQNIACVFEESHSVIRVSETCGFENRGHVYSITCRNNNGVIIEDKEFVSMWFHRMQKHIEKYVEEYKIKRGWNNNTVGKVTGMNPKLRVCKYTKHDNFLPHTDLDHSKPGFTIMAYINEVSCGVHTAPIINTSKFFRPFYSSNDMNNMSFNLNMTNNNMKGSNTSTSTSTNRLSCSVLIFPHDLLHYGDELCTANLRYIIQSELFFD